MSFTVEAPAPRPAPLGAGRRGARLLRTIAAAGVSLGVAGCYIYTPLYSAPGPGTRIVLELNDRGRFALEQNIGPEVAAVEGIIESASDSQLVLSVMEIRGLYGSRSRWAGELVTMKPEHVRTMRERQYSRGRTIALASMLASTTVAFMVTRSIFGGGTAGDDGDPGVPNPDDQ